jgi:hypothetical protein
MGQGNNAERLTLDQESFLRVRIAELREARRLAHAAQQRIDSGALDTLTDELLDVAAHWQDGDSGEKAIALIAQVARLARTIKAPRDIIAAAARLEQGIKDARREWGVADDYEPEDLDDSDL